MTTRKTAPLNTVKPPNRDDRDTYTVAELAALLDPPMTIEQVRALITIARTPPVAKRRPGSQGGRPARTYRLADVLDAHQIIAPLLLEQAGDS